MVVEPTHNDAILTATLSFIMETITCSSAQIADAEYTYQDQKEGPTCVFYNSLRRVD
jgi:hypothetical protein